MISPSVNDLPYSLSKLRKILEKKSIDNDEIDSDTIECIESITRTFSGLCQRYPPTKTFPFVHEISKIYIRDLLSNTNALKILSNGSFQQIFCTANSRQFQNDLAQSLEQNSEFAQKVFYESWELLSLPLMIDFLHNIYPREIFSHICVILDTVLVRTLYAAMYIECKSNDLLNQKQTISLLMNYVDENKKTIKEYLTKHIVTKILTLIWNLADNTILIPTLIEINCHTYFLKWLSLTYLPIEIHQMILHILHNIARHDQGVVALNDGNCLSILRYFKQLRMDPNKENQNELYTDLRFIYSMILSYLIEPKDNREDLKDIKNILDRLLQLIIDAGQADNNKNEGFHVSEPLVVLTKLFVHDDILKYVLNESLVVGLQTKTKTEFFIYLLFKFRGALASTNDLDQLTLSALVNLLWSISFHPEYTEELKSNSKFLMTIKSLTNNDGLSWVTQYVPKHMSTIPKAANGILFNLQEANPMRSFKSTAIQKIDEDIAPMAEKSHCRRETDSILAPAVKPSESSEKKEAEKTVQQIHVMVSYCHADKDICRQIVEALQKDNHLHVWVDFIYCHSEDLWEEIAEAIEKADVILFLMSKDYQDSKSCRQEVMYSKDSLKKRFIPIYTKKDFVATGWLGVRIVGPQYIRFGKKSFDETAKELIKLIASDKKEELLETTKETKPPPVILTSTNDVKPNEDNSIPETVIPSKQPVEKWAKKDIHNWFQSNQIQRELADLYNFQHGTDLLLYGECLRPNWQNEYNEIKERYQQKYNRVLYRDEFVRFVGAINRLEKSSSTRSKACVIC